jgi:hypothetical protein
MLRYWVVYFFFELRIGVRYWGIAFSRRVAFSRREDFTWRRGWWRRRGWRKARLKP